MNTSGRMPIPHIPHRVCSNSPIEGVRMCAFCAVSVRICTSNYRAKLNLIMRFLLI